MDSPTYFHGTKADLKVGDLVGPGDSSNYGSRRKMRAHLAELARQGIEAIEERERPEDWNL